MENIDVKKFGKVALLMGGNSHEREVSLWSGQYVLEILQSAGVDVVPIDVNGDVIDTLKNGNFDRALIMMHGRGGEDGTMQAVLEYLKIPYTGSDICSSALSMDKARSKWLFQQFKLPTLPFYVLDDQTDFEGIIEEFLLPICVKPAHEGSTVGVIKVTESSQFRKAHEESLKIDSLILAEPWIEGREFTVSILEGKALPVIEIIPEASCYDFNAKYLSDKTRFECPANLAEQETRDLQNFAERAFEILGCFGWGRADFLRDERGNFWITEMNTVPGMTKHSLFPLAAKAAGIEIQALVLRILQTSFKR